MTREEREIESLRENTQTLSIFDCSETTIRRVVNGVEEKVREHMSDEIEIEGYYICGSFATGDALEGISDLDMRVKISEPISKETNQVIGETVKRMELETDVFGYIDVQCLPTAPKETESVNLENIM